MTIRTIKTKVYTIESHPNPELCYDWIRNNWHSLGNYVVQEALDSLKAFAEHIDATFNYSISIVPCRGEYISIDTSVNKLKDLPQIDLSGNCPLTGVWADEVILDSLRNKDENTCVESIFNDIEFNMLKAIHNEGEYIYSDEGLREMCEANGYEFNEDGSVY
jgi:hypothetical protein